MKGGDTGEVIIGSHQFRKACSMQYKKCEGGGSTYGIEFTRPGDENSFFRYRQGSEAKLTAVVRTKNQILNYPVTCSVFLPHIDCILL